MCKFSDGLVPVEALAERLRGADLGVLASRLKSDTDLMLPVKLLEYVRRGIPCAAVPTKTIRRYFSEECVRYIKSDNPTALAEVTRAARQFYDKHTYEAQRKAYTEIINELAAKRRPNERDMTFLHLFVLPLW